jgi:hypothetical protein
VGDSSHWAAVPRSSTDEPVDESGAMTEDLNTMADWLLGRHGGAGVDRGVLDRAT